MRYKTTRKADQDLIEIYVRGVEDFGTVQAEQYAEGLFSTFDLLAENPHMARERVELDPPMRLHPHHSHMIVYTLRDGSVLIVRILHGRQDWQSLLS